MSTPNFDLDPILLIGSRAASGDLDVYRVETDQTVGEALTTVSRDAWATGNERERMDYHPHSDIEADECFVLPAETAPTRPIGRKPRAQPDNRPQRAASLWQAIALASEHDRVLPADILAVAPTFYAICIPCDDGSTVGFVRNSSPTRALGKGRVLLGMVGLGGRDRLSRVAEPSLSLDATIDIIVTPDEILAMSRVALERLLSDVKLMQSSVPINMVALGSFLRKVKIDADSITVIEHACKSGQRASGRLAELAKVDATLLTKSVITKALRGHGLGSLITPAGLRVTERDVADLLDCLTGRLYEDVISAEKRRAVRYAPRT